MRSSGLLQRASLVWITLAAFSLFACFPFDGDESEKHLKVSSLLRRTWVLNTHTRNGSTDTLSDSTLRVVFSDSGAVSLFGCNVTRGTFTLERDTIRFGPMYRTAMACLSATRQSGDAWADSLLAGPLAARVSGGELFLTLDESVFRLRDSAKVK